MLTMIPRLPVMSLAGLFLLPLLCPMAHAQEANSQFRVQSTPTGPPSGPTGAGFHGPQFSNPYMPTGPYGPYYDPYSGYLNGVADVSGQYLVNQQYAHVVRQQSHQAKLETRRKAFDEYLYERDKMPTMEDDRERARIESVRRSYNDPPITEIWSGKALNDLLDAIHKMDIQKGPGPKVGLDTSLLRDVNVSAGGLSGNLGLLRDGGRLQWPLVLRGSTYAGDRKRMNDLAMNAYRQAQGDGVDPDTVNGMSKTLDQLTATLKDHVSDVAPNDYIRAKRYLNDLGDTLQALQDPKVGNYATGKWSAQGNTVTELVENMFRNGLRFAPATPGDQAAYVALHRALVSYYSWPDKPWDQFAK
jgi:hypothetical protein